MIDIRELVDEAVASERKNNRGDDKWHVSSLGMCLGGAYFERKGIAPDYEHDARTLRVFHVGNVFEEWLLDNAVKKLGKDYQLETQEDLEDKESNLVGHPDGVIRKGETIDSVWEVKTQHSRAFWHMDKEGSQGKDHHRLQLWCYLKMLNHPQGILIYISKDDLATRQYGVELDDPQLEAEFKRVMKELQDAWERQSPPQVVTDPMDWRYHYCRHHSYCLEAAGVDEFWIKDGTDIYRNCQNFDRYEKVAVEGRKTPQRFKVCSIDQYRQACQFEGLA